MAEIQNVSEESKIENTEEEQPKSEIEDVDKEEQQTSVTDELVQTEIVKLTVVKEKLFDNKNIFIHFLGK
jgi:hypothetical protein